MLLVVLRRVLPVALAPEPPTNPAHAGFLHFPATLHFPAFLPMVGQLRTRSAPHWRFSGVAEMVPPGTTERQPWSGTCASLLAALGLMLHEYYKQDQACFMHHAKPRH